MPDRIGRRTTLAAALGALAAIGAGKGPRMATRARQPAVYLPHGGGPWPFLKRPFGDPGENAALLRYLQSIATLSAEKPSAVLVVTAHWEERVVTLGTNAKPGMLYDYFGFPPEAYEVTWPAPGAPALAARVERLLADAGIPSARDPERGWDHGTFVPMKVAFPEPTIPALQVSLKAGLDPAEHLAIGRALAPLRDEGVLIVGSGSSFHNLRAFGHPSVGPVSEQFDAWLRETTLAPRARREENLVGWARAPSARLCHPREEHLLPLMVVAGAAGDDPGKVTFQGRFMGVVMSAHQFG